MRTMKWMICAAACLFFTACEKVDPNYPEFADNPEFYHRSVKQLTDVIVHDIFSPPVASRIYSYAAIAGYEAMAPGNPEYQSLAGQLRDLTEVPKPEAGQEYCFPLAGVTAYLTLSKNMIFSEEKIDAFRNQIMAEFEAFKMPKVVFDRSVAYGEAVASHILAWSKGDNYAQTRTFPKYSISDDPARWQPTPPDYMDAIEPHWNKIRPLVLDSAQQFAPPPPTPFSTDKNSQFYKEAMEVYEALNAADKEERLNIARFWDCNPYVSHHTGHVMFATKKITPGGHWIGITAIACRKAQADLMQSAEAYALTSIALAEGFKSCWDEKYRSNLIRPETVINRYIDEEWLPALQTPPFPEYTSGHSVISRAAATVLTSLFGDNFAYTDNVEEEYGLTVRSFNSFLEASEEAAVSRLYGGIHYRPAIDNGVAQGGKVGQLVVERVRTKAALGER